MRFQAELSPRDAAVLQSLMGELEVEGNAVLMSNLLALASWAVSERRRGRRIAAFGDQGPVRELVMPLLERVAPGLDLPRVEIEWTREELENLASLMVGEPAEPTEKLGRLLDGR